MLQAPPQRELGTAHQPVGDHLPVFIYKLCHVDNANALVVAIVTDANPL